ncbi:MAG: leucyl/phenylalanyl-tRNA--protein transferase [Acidobacteriota bacterium]
MNDGNQFSEDELLEPENMLILYSRGAFPMADEEGRIDWYWPQTRTVIPLDNYNFPRSLRKFMEKSGFEYRYDYSYMRVIKGCAGRETTWISDKLIKAYKRLHKAGHLHTVEAWKDDKIVGGLYGISYRGAFFGESMFSKTPQASKACLIKLIEHLNEKGFQLLDVQYQTEHLKMFGAVEITFQQYEELLGRAYLADSKF